MTRNALLLALLGVALAGCTDAASKCRSSADCRSDDLGQGSCEPTGFCSYYDSDCASDWRYGPEAHPTYASYCVPGLGEATPECGDGLVRGDEACDGASLAGLSCQSEGFAGGALQCAADCTVDTSFCHACGNGVADPGETCDGSDLGGIGSCAEVGLGSISEPVVCSATCGLDFSSCSACGDGVVEEPEECDPHVALDASCTSLGFHGGTLRCSAGCGFDTSGCYRCGNATREQGESCDGADVGAQSCVSLGFDGGELACADDCTFDETSCSTCGDGQRTATEACDQLDLGGQSCQQLGLGAGALSCTDACTFDVSGCQDARSATCGDGNLDPGEACDGEELGGHSCASQGFDGGELTCGQDCGFRTDGCALCGDGEVQAPDEECDPGEAATAQCSELCRFHDSPMNVRAGAELTVQATIGAQCLLTGDACEVEGDGTFSTWQSMTTSGCTVLCPIDSVVRFTCSTGGQPGRVLEAIYYGNGATPKLCGPAEQTECSVDLESPDSALLARCIYAVESEA